MNIPELMGLVQDAQIAMQRVGQALAELFPARDPLLALPAPVAAIAPAPVARKTAAVRGKYKTRRAAAAKPQAASARKPNGGGRVWTDDRNAILRRDWPKDVPTSDIRAALNRLPGPKIPDNGRIAAAAGQLGLHRPGHKPRQSRTPPAEDASPPAPPMPSAAPKPVAPAAASVAPRAPVVAPNTPARSPRVPPNPLLTSRDGAVSVAQRQLAEDRAVSAVASVSWGDAMTWAHRNQVKLGDTEEGDLLATNARRRELQLPPFAIVDRRGRPEPLPEPKLGGNYEAAAA